MRCVFGMVVCLPSIGNEWPAFYMSAHCKCKPCMRKIPVAWNGCAPREANAQRSSVHAKMQVAFEQSSSPTATCLSNVLPLVCRIHYAGRPCSAAATPEMTSDRVCGSVRVLGDESHMKSIPRRQLPRERPPCGSPHLASTAAISHCGRVPPRVKYLCRRSIGQGMFETYLP